MTMRVYDISKKLGLEPKTVIAQAKKMGITSAKIASSALDDLSAERLEEALRELHPYVPPPADGNN